MVVHFLWIVQDSHTMCMAAVYTMGHIQGNSSSEFVFNIEKKCILGPIIHTRCLCYHYKSYLTFTLFHSTVIS